MKDILGEVNEAPTCLEQDVQDQQTCQAQDVGKTVPPLSRRERATRLRRLLGRDPPSYLARANLTKQLETLEREEDKLVTEVRRCRRQRNATRDQQEQDVLEEVARGLEDIAHRYREGLRGLRKK